MDLIDFGAQPAAPEQASAAGASSPTEGQIPAKKDSMLLNFDPLSDSAPTQAATSTPKDELGMPDTIAAAFAAAAAEKTSPQLNPQAPPKEEFGESGLSKDGQADLMRMIQEDAKKMKSTGDSPKGEQAQRVTIDMPLC